MTCIVGFRDNDSVTLGGDHTSSDDSLLTLSRTPKVFKVGSYVMGHTSSWRLGNILQNVFTPPDDFPDDDRDELHSFMCRHFTGALRACLRKEGWLEKRNEREAGGRFLVGVRGALFVIQNDFSIYEPMAPYAAIGAGTPYALGALHAQQMLGYPAGGALPVIGLALQAAAEHSQYVRPPYSYVVADINKA